MKYHVPDMSCGHCTAAITKEIQTADPGSEISTDLATRMVTVHSSRAPADILSVLAAAGYPAHLAD